MPDFSSQGEVAKVSSGSGEKQLLLLGSPFQVRV